MSDYIWSKYHVRNVLKYLESGPMYVKTHEKYGDRVFLVQNEEDLVNTMLKLLSNWNDCEWVPQVDWYFDGTYEEFFLKEMGFNHVWFEEHIGNRTSHVNHHMQKVAESGKRMKSNYNDNVAGLEEARLIEDILTNGLAKRAGQLYNLLSELRWNDRLMFELCEFDKI